jgi:outer membrane lipoprotein-sorting protein
MEERQEKSFGCNLKVYLVAIAVVVAGQPGFASEVRNKQELSMLSSSGLSSDNFQDGKDVIAKMYTAAESLNNYSFDYEMLVYKEKPPIKETGTLCFRKPRLLKVEVHSGPKKGSLAILAADGKVHGHMGGALKFFSASVSPDSQLVRASNGYPMVDTDFLSIVAYLKNMLKQGDFSRATSQPIQTDKVTSPTYVVDMYSVKSGQELLLKRIYADAKTLLPRYWEDYVDGKLWSQSFWQNFKANVDFPGSTFKP